MISLVTVEMKATEQYFPVLSCGTVYYFFLKHFSGPESGILEFDWLLTRVPPVQFFPIRTGFVLVTEPRENH